MAQTQTQNGDVTHNGDVNHHGDGEIVDGVHRSPASGMKAVVVGTGPAGLFAAIELWRKGIEVSVLEQTPEFKPAGELFTVTPSGLSSIKYYPTLRAEHEANANDASTRFCTSDYRLIFDHEPEWKLCTDGHAAKDVKTSMINFRFQFQKMIMDQCRRLGIPFHFGKKVVQYEETDKEATVLTDDGERFTADVVVAADGIASKSNILVRGGEVPFQSTGYASAQCGMPFTDIDPDSKAAHLLPRPGERPQFHVFLGPPGDLILGFVRGYIGFIFTHKDSGEKARESWSPRVPAREIIDKYFKEDEWDDRILSLARQIKGPMVDWCLTWRDPHPQWTSPLGRVVQIGDAAHPYLPTSGNGATQSIEDGISLAECLKLGGRDSVPTATRTFTLLRFKRVSVIQRVGFVSRNALEVFKFTDLAKFKNPLNWGKWNWGFNPEEYVQKRYTEAAACIENGTESEFEHTNLPPGFVWEEWTMESELKRIRNKQTPSNVRMNGYWGWQ